MRERRDTGRSSLWLRLELAVLVALLAVPAAMSVVVMIRDLLPATPDADGKPKPVADMVRQMKISGEAGITFQSGRDGLFRTTVLFSDTPVEMIIDTGATHSILSQQDAQRLFGSMAGREAGQIQTGGGPRLLVLRRLASVEIAGRRLTDVEIGLVADFPVSIIGANWLERLGPLHLERRSMAAN